MPVGQGWGEDMDGLWKAAATALTVAVLMGLARGAGHRVAGLLAALPTTTAPALVWLAADQGPAFAARAAVAEQFTLVSTPM